MKSISVQNLTTPGSKSILARLARQLADSASREFQIAEQYAYTSPEAAQSASSAEQGATNKENSKSRDVIWAANLISI
jgi:hypothetical protein